MADALAANARVYLTQSTVYVLSGWALAQVQQAKLFPDSGAFPEEIPLCEMMLGLLRGAVRPEISEEEAVEDLRMLAKQGVSLAEMNEVLSSLLAVLPTPDMLEGVRLIYQQTPRWALMKSAVMH